MKLLIIQICSTNLLNEKKNFWEAFEVLLPFFVETLELIN